MVRYPNKKFKMKYIIQNEAPLLSALATFFPESSKNTLRQWIEDGRIEVDGQRAQTSQMQVLVGQELVFGSRVKHLHQGIRLLYEDDDLLVIDKPEGLLSVATNFEQTKTAHAILKQTFRPRMIHVIHRLDQETSGVMLFALSDQAKVELKKLFAKHDLLREYIAIVEGHLSPKKGSWTNYLIEDDHYKVHVTEDQEKGEMAITHYAVENTSRRFTRLRLTLETGRKNQIRVQCQEAGHPVIGDRKYGSFRNPLKRLALHAHRLEFVHPITHKKLSFKSPVPEEFDRLVK